MDPFQAIREALRNRGKHSVAAKVVSIDSGLMTADVVIEGEDVIREKIPLRIFNDEGGLGIAIIPKIDSEVLIGFIDGAEARPSVIKVQEWDMLIMRKGATDAPSLEIIIDSDNKVDLRKDSGFQFTIDAEDKVSIGNAPSHKIAWGDVWLPKFNTHTHPTPTGPSGPPMQPLVDEEVNSALFTVE